MVFLLLEALLPESLDEPEVGPIFRAFNPGLQAGSFMVFLRVIWAISGAGILGS